MSISSITNANTIASTELRTINSIAADKASDHTKTLGQGVTLSENAQHLSRLDALLNSAEQKSKQVPEPIDLQSMELLTEKQGTLLTGMENTLSLGWILLGQSADEWKQKGLELDKESVLEAGRVLQKAFRQALEENPEGQFALSFDRHGIVASQQSVPDWFIAERNQELSLLPDSDRQSFESGMLFHIVDRA